MRKLKLTGLFGKQSSNIRVDISNVVIRRINQKLISESSARTYHDGG